MSTNKNANASNAKAENSKPTKPVANVALVLSKEESAKWAALRASGLKQALADLAQLPADKILELASQRVARLIDERHNTAALKVAATPETLLLATLLDSKRLSPVAKSNVQEAFANLLMSGTLAGAAKSAALEVFKSGKVADMATFLAAQQVAK